MAGRNFTEEEDALIVRWADEGMTRIEMAERLGRSESGVFWRIRRLLGTGVAVAPANPNAARPKGAAIARQLGKKSTWRNCMCCRKRFLSEGAHNRLCTSCRNISVDCFSAPAPVLR